MPGRLLRAIRKHTGMKYGITINYVHSLHAMYKHSVVIDN